MGKHPNDRLQVNRRARFYSLTPTGRAQLAAEQERWSQLTDAVSRVLRFA
jgi:PadR family transcriptional regulator, regulatory protein PadR